MHSSMLINPSGQASQRQTPLVPHAGPHAGSLGSRARPVGTDAVKPMVSMLLQIALVGAQHGLAHEVDVIRPVLLMFGINADAFDLARALSLLQAGDAGACAEILEREVLRRDPSHEQALALRVCAWHALDVPQWRAEARALLAIATDARARHILRVQLAEGL
jgi:hypothetical protein